MSFLYFIFFSNLNSLNIHQEFVEDEFIAFLTEKGMKW
ncbi:hypothetical protein C8C84_0282 [Flavobacterium sp. 102]|nr:hypothetical protein C8C84_0282 [Flavobacterium sp. 102]